MRSFKLRLSTISGKTQLNGAEFRFRLIQDDQPGQPKLPAKEVIRSSGRMGGILAKHLSKGTWECKVRYRNHINQTMQVYVNPGVTTRLIVKIEPKAALNQCREPGARIKS